MTEEFCSDCAKRCKRCGTPLPTYNESTVFEREPWSRPSEPAPKRPGRPKRGGE